MKKTDPLDDYIDVKIMGTYFQILSLLMLCLLVVINTSLSTLTDNVLPLVQKDYELSDLWTSIISGFSNTGSVIGTIVANILWKKIGPMRILKISLLFTFAFVYLVFFAEGFYFCFVAWIILSFSSSIAGLPIAVYLAETAPLQSRGRWTVAFGVSATCGRIFSTLLSHFLITEDSASSWKNPLFFHAVLYAMIAIPIFIYFQESLRYLYANKKHEEFVVAINRIIQMNQRKIDKRVTPDLSTLEEVRSLGNATSNPLAEKPSEQSQFHELLSKKYISLILVLVFAWIFFVAHFAGFGIILSFWFEKYGSLGKYLSMGMTYSSEFLAMLTIYFMIDNEHFGRKKSMQIFSALSCVLYCANYFVKNQTAVIGFFILERYCMKSTVILLNTYTSEIFPTRLRNIGLSFNNISISIFAAFLPMIVIRLFHWYDYAVFLFFFGSAASFFLVSFFMWKDRTKRSLYLSRSMISGGDGMSIK